MRTLLGKNRTTLRAARVKRQLEKIIDKTRRRYIKTFFSFDKDDLATLLHELGIQHSDLVMAHSSFDRFLGFTDVRGGPSGFDSRPPALFPRGVRGVIKVLQEAVGESGTLAMPTFPFSGTAFDYVARGQVTDVRKTRSKTGIISDVFWRLPGVVRSVHPTHPVAAWGARAEELIADSHLAKTPCGRGTPFYRLLELNGKILLMGTEILSMTFYHAVEEILEPEMPFSPFTKEWFTLHTRDAQGRLVESRLRLFDPEISKRRDVRILIPILKRLGFWQEGRVGRLPVIVLRAEDVLHVCRHMATNGLFCYR